MTPILIAGPASEPVSLEECKAWMRVDSDADDALIAALVTSARLVLEAATRRLFISQTWRIISDQWPAEQTFSIPLAPLISLDALRVYDVANVAAAVPATCHIPVGDMAVF